MSDPTPSPDTVLVGRVVRPHGIRGEVLVEPLTDNPGRLAAGATVGLEAPAGREAPPAPTAAIAASRPHKGGWLVRFAGVDDRDGAELLRGFGLTIDRREVPPAAPGTYWQFELVGCRCRDRRLGDLGEVVDLAEDGGGLILLVDDGRRQLPIPFVAAFLPRIDVAGRVIETELPPGLVEACASGS